MRFCSLVDLRGVMKIYSFTVALSLTESPPKNNIQYLRYMNRAVRRAHKRSLKVFNSCAQDCIPCVQCNVAY